MFLKDGASEAGSGTESELANLDEDTREELETNVVSYLFVFSYIYVREGFLGVQCTGGSPLTDALVKRTPRVGLFFSLLPLFDSLNDGHLSQTDVHPKVSVLERVETIRTC